MAWGYGTTKADAKAYEAAVETGAAEADVDSKSFYLDESVGPTMEFDAPAWYGEDETYGTQSDWLTGEGLTSAWGSDQDKIQSTYAHPVMEAIGENPLANLLVDARGILSRGGSPSALDWGMLGLSALPPAKIAGTAAIKAIKSANQAPFDPTRRTALQRIGTAVAQPGATLGAIVDQTSPLVQESFRAINAMRDKISARLARAKEMKTDLDLTKDLDELGKLYDQIETPPISQATHDKIMKMAADKAKEMRLKEANETFSEKVVRLADKQAYKEKAAALEKKAKAENDLRDKVLSMDEKQFDDWLSTASVEDVEVILETQGVDVDKLLAKVTKTISTHDPMVVAEKMSFKPPRVSHEIWAQETSGLTLSETKDLARRLTLRIVD